MLYEKKIDEIDASDLHNLALDNVLEGPNLEYKRELNLKNGNHRRKLLKTVCAFANTQGGLLIYGISEADGKLNFEGLALENVENELTEEVKAQVKSGFDDFTSLLSAIELDPRLASLWKLIYANAMTDRKNAFALFLDLYVITFSDNEKHFQHGQTLTKYMEAMSRANQQLLKLADLVDKARAHGLIISKFLENKLQEYFNFINAVSYKSIPSKKESVDWMGFEPMASTLRR